MARASGDNSEKTEKHKKQMIIISFLSVLNILLFLIEIYEILNDQNNLPIIGALGVFILAAVYVETVFIRRIGISRIKEQEEAYHNIYRSEKASYLLLRKSFEQMEQKLEKIEKQSAIPYDDLIASQKALTKVQINRGKENTSVLMTANNQIIDKLNTIQRTIENVNTMSSDIMSEGRNSFAEDSKEILIGQQTLTDGNKNILEKQENILNHIKEMEESLKHEIQNSAHTINSLKKQIEENQFQKPEILNNEQALEPLNFENLSLDQDKSLDQNGEMDQNESIIENEGFNQDDSLLQNADHSQEEDLIANVDLGQNGSLLQNNQEKSKERQINKNSLETDLDQLLKEMNNGAGASLSEENVVDVDNFELEPITDSSELEPNIDNTELEPIIEEPEVKPIMEEAVLEPTIEEPALAQLGPITDDLDLESFIQNSNLESIMNDSNLESASEDMNIESVANDLELEPINNDSMLESVSPIVDETESKSGDQLIIEEPEVQPVEGLDLDPGIEQMINELEQEPEIHQMAEKSESEIQPLVIDSDIQPINDEEFDLDNIQLDDLEINPKQEINQISQDEIDGMIDGSSDSLNAPVSDLSEPEHVMSADEIATLLANTDSLEEPKPIEDKPSMPDLSDPGHVMSADEIAALIANL